MIRLTKIAVLIVKMILSNNRQTTKLRECAYGASILIFFLLSSCTLCFFICTKQKTVRELRDRKDDNFYSWE